jgi:hypothetical protein
MAAAVASFFIRILQNFFGLLQQAAASRIAVGQNNISSY